MLHLNANDPTLKFVTNITKQVIQKYMQKSELKVNMKIILISKVQTEENSYIASEAACKYADEMVNIKKIYTLMFYIVYYIKLMIILIYIYIYIYIYLSNLYISIYIFYQLSFYIFRAYYIYIF